MQHERGRQDLFEDVTLMDLKERLPKNETEMNLDVVKIEFVVLDGV